jgi:1,4-alpha-glucan branching enzyme
MTQEKKTRQPENPHLITDHDVYLFKEGSHYKLYDKLGSHLIEVAGVRGAQFAVWAPNAREVSVVGEFNEWVSGANRLEQRQEGSGIWEGFIPALERGANYKYHIVSQLNDYRVDKGDPYAFRWEPPPRAASVVWDLDYQWNDSDWMANRSRHNALDAPMSTYEVHLGSWRRVPEENNRSLTYREAAHQLADYVKEMGFTHVELMPVMEHPFYGSWGYQIIGYFAPTGRYGTPQDLMYLVDHLHQNGIGVIFDWVPSHFPSDENGLVYFDGTHLYEHADPRKGFHPDWNSYIFNHGRNEVRAFLTSNAMYWLDKYHIDGLRVDAVASMLYLDYSRKEGEWLPNRFGGRENLEAIDFLKRLNTAVFEAYPDTQTIAEESTSWPMVSRPLYLGGLGFGMKWNMGWMHDILEYMTVDPIYRKYQHSQLTFSLWYAFTENFVLPFSHDEVVYGKGSLLGRMPGDEWQKFANLRLLFGYTCGHPGKKLQFMGNELAQYQEWNHDTSLDWHLLDYPGHLGVQRWLKDLNHFYQKEPALYEQDYKSEGFRWVDFRDWEKSAVSFLRFAQNPRDTLLVVCNFTPMPRTNYRLGVPVGGFWIEALNSDATLYGGSGYGNLGGVEAVPVPSHGMFDSISLVVPPLSALFLKPELSTK